MIDYLQDRVEGGVRLRKKEESEVIFSFLGLLSRVGVVPWDREQSREEQVLQEK